MELLVWTVDDAMHAQIHIYVLFRHLRLTMAWSSKMSFNFSSHWESKLFASWFEPHPTSMGLGSRSLGWYYVLGVYTEWAVLTSAPQSVAGALDRTFPPLRMTLTDGWTHDCDWPAPTPTTSMKHTPLSLRLSPEPSTPVFTSHPHSRCLLNISTHIPFPPLPPSFGSQLAHALRAWGE